MEKKSKSGYVIVYCPEHKHSKTKNGWIFEHRIVIENFINQGLKIGQCIHHIDLNKTNNKIENLMIFNSNKEHSSWHNKLKRHGLTNPMKRFLENRWKEYEN